MWRIAIFLTAGVQKREWLLKNFEEVADRFSKQCNCEWVLLGGDNRSKIYALQFCQKHPALHTFNFTGQTSLRETCAILQQCDAYLGGDTGPMHIAAAVHLPGVVLSCHPKTGKASHANSPVRFGPWQNSNMIVLRPYALLPECYDGCAFTKSHCINQISVEEVCHSLARCLNENT